MIKTIAYNPETHVLVPKGMMYELPGLPMPISKGEFSKDLFDGFQMHQYAMRYLDEAIAAAPQPEQVESEPVIINGPNYHYEAMGCGLEDRNITDRYEAMQYGWECAISRIFEQIPDEPLYTTPQPDRTAELEQLRQQVAEKDEVIAEAGEMLAMRDRQLAALKAAMAQGEQ